MNFSENFPRFGNDGNFPRSAKKKIAVDLLIVAVSMSDKNELTTCIINHINRSQAGQPIIIQKRCCFVLITIPGVHFTRHIVKCHNMIHILAEHICVFESKFDNDISSKLIFSFVHPVFCSKHRLVDNFLSHVFLTNIR